MKKLELDFSCTQVAKIISCDPDRLIELGHRLKQTAFDSTLPGESVLAELVPGIMLCYSPEKEFTKPVHRYENVSAPISTLAENSV